MKSKFIGTILTIVGALYLGGVSVEASTPIDKKTFPDPVFRETIENQFDGNEDKVLSDKELEQAIWYEYWGDLSKKSMSMEGMERLYNLRKVVVGNVKINQPPLKNLKHLEYLRLVRTGIESIDLRSNKKLKTLIINNLESATSLRSIDLTQSVGLESMKIVGNKIASISATPVCASAAANAPSSR